MSEARNGGDMAVMIYFSKLHNLPAVLPSLERPVYQIIGIHNKQLNERGNDRQSNVRYAGETCRASPNFGDRCQRHRSAHFRGVGRQELSPRSDENPIYGIAGDKPYPFTSWAKKEREREGQWERCLKGAAVVVRQKRVAMTPQREWRDLWSLPPSSNRRQPQSATVVVSWLLEPSGTWRERGAAHDLPRGIRRRRNRRVMSMSSRDFTGAQSPALSRKFAALAHRREGEASTYQRMVISRYERAISYRVPSPRSEFSSMYRVTTNENVCVSTYQ